MLSYLQPNFVSTITRHGNFIYEFSYEGGLMRICSRVVHMVDVPPSSFALFFPSQRPHGYVLSKYLFISLHSIGTQGSRFPFLLLCSLFCLFGTAPQQCCSSIWKGEREVC